MIVCGDTDKCGVAAQLNVTFSDIMMIEEYFVCIYKLTTSITSIHPFSNLVDRFSGYSCLRLSTAYWCERPELFAAIADAKDGEGSLTEPSPS